MPELSDKEKTLTFREWLMSLFFHAILGIYKVCYEGVIFCFNQIIAFISRRNGFGAFRFVVVRKIYFLMHIFCGYPNTRNERWDFILQYLPALGFFVFWRNLPVLDIGCNGSLLLFELKKRGYSPYGMDIENYHQKLPRGIGFYRESITDDDIIKKTGEQRFYYIIATSVIELVGVGMYDDKKVVNADRVAIENIHKLLFSNGYFIISVPIENWRSRLGRGYGIEEFKCLIKGLFTPIEITQRGGHLCAVLVKASS